MGVGSGQFANILKGDEVERFLGGFVLPDNVRAAAERDNPGAKFPKDTNDVLKDVKDIWDKKGFLSPAELRSELVQRYTPNADPKLSQFLKDIELSRNVPESTTGYLSKEHAYSGTGLAHLYAKETGKPIAMVEVDFSNMGGTNEEFKRRIAAERGIPVSEVPQQHAEKMTDRAVRHLCDTMTKSLGDSLPKDAKIIPIRTGGDEVRLIFTGVDDPEELQRITKKMHAMIEVSVARMGLQNHPHLKDPDNPVRNGFGAAVTIQDMNKIHNPDTLIQELDERIKIQKEKIGHDRLGTIDEKFERNRIQDGIHTGALKIPDGQTQAQFVQSQLDETRQQSHRTSEQLRQANPMHNPALTGGIAGFDKYIADITPKMGTTPIVSAPLPSAILESNPVGLNRPANVAPLADMAERRASVAASHLSEQNIKVSTSEQHFLGQSVRNLTSIDPSAQVSMPTNMIALAEIHAREGQEFRDRLDPNDPKVVDGLKRSGLQSTADVKSNIMAVSFHNLAGLNSELGHNNADLYLRHFSTIMDDSFKAAGFEGTGKKPYTIAHHGGGNFTVMVDPVAVDAKGNMTFMSPDKLKDVEKKISAGVDTLNKKNVADFMQERGVRVTPEMRADMAKKGITTTATIPDPKEREFSGDKNIKARVDGIHSVVAINAVDATLEGPIRTQQMVHDIRNQADAKMGKLRDAKVIAQHQVIPEGRPSVDAISKPLSGSGTVAPSVDAPRPHSVTAAPTTPHLVAAFSAAAPLTMQNQPSPHNTALTQGNLALAPQPQVQPNLTPAPDKKPIVNPATAPEAANEARVKPTPAPTAESSAPVKASIGATGAKVDNHSGRAQLAIQVAAEASKGNYVAAATTAAVAIAEQQGIKFVAKRVPVIGGFITAGMTLWAAGSAAVDGNWKKAGSELAAGAAETVGNVVGFGLGDAAREGARKALITAGVKEENAPDKSGLRQAAETAYDMAKTIKNSAQLKSMTKAELAQSIQKDPALPDNVNLKGKQVTLAQAMEDKTFRTAMIKNMEAEAKKDPSMNVRVAALKEYGARLDAADAAKPQVAASKPTPTSTQPAAATATTATPAVKPATPVPTAATVIADAQYKSMTVNQLASVIQKDPTMVDTVKIGGKEMQLSEALKDKEFRKTFLERLEKADAAGTDMDKQIAMVKAYEAALEKPQPATPAVQMAQQAPRVAAPSMG